MGQNTCQKLWYSITVTLVHLHIGEHNEFLGALIKIPASCMLFFIVTVNHPIEKFLPKRLEKVNLVTIIALLKSSPTILE